MNISKNDYGVLRILYQNKCSTEIKSFTIKKIKEEICLSISKIRQSIQKFKKLGFIKEGAVQERNAKTYYITKEGIERLEELI